MRPVLSWQRAWTTADKIVLFEFYFSFLSAVQTTLTNSIIVRENVVSHSKKRKKSRFLDFEKKT